MTDDSLRRHAPATLRNREPVLSILHDILPDSGTVLEIASGSGEHVAYLAPHFPGLEWQPTDIDRDNFASIQSWTDDVGGNIRAPVYLDTRESSWPTDTVSAIMCMNMLHISPWDSAVGLMAGARRVLGTDGILFIYGPFRQRGVAFAPSNASFDEFLQMQDPAWGVRDLDDVEALANKHGLVLEKVVEMPANNLSIIFRRRV